MLKSQYAQVVTALIAGAAVANGSQGILHLSPLDPINAVFSAFADVFTDRRKSGAVVRPHSNMQEAAVRAVRQKGQRQHGDQNELDLSNAEWDALPHFAALRDPEWEQQKTERLAEKAEILRAGSAARPPLVKLWTDRGKQRFSCG